MTTLDSAQLSISDLGFIHGVTVTEQLRTFQGSPFLLDQHLDRFDAGVQLLEILVRESRQELVRIIMNLIRQFLESSQLPECGVGLFATPGNSPRFGGGTFEPVLCVYCYALPFREYQPQYQKGARLVISDTVDVDAGSWPKQIKVRSRLHYYLADLQAKN